MITAKVKFKRKKLSLEDKAMQKALTKVAGKIKKRIKQDAPKDTGALRKAVDYKILKRGIKSSAIVGIKNQFSIEKRGIEKIPNLYAKKMDDMTKFISKNLDKKDIEQLREDLAKEIEKIMGA